MNKNRDKLKSLLTEAAKRPMTKEEREAQAQSFVRAEAGFGSDADEAAYLAALSAGDTAAIKRLEAESKARMDAADQYFEGKAEGRGK